MEAKYIDLDSLSSWGLTVTTLALKLDMEVCRQMAKGNNAMYIEWWDSNHRRLPETLKPIATLPEIALKAIAEAFKAKGVNMQVHYTDKEIRLQW